MSYMIFLILAANLALLYFAYDISRELRRILRLLDDKRLEQTGVSKPCDGETLSVCDHTARHQPNRPGFSVLKDRSVLHMSNWNEGFEPAFSIAHSLQGNWSITHSHGDLGWSIRNSRPLSRKPRYFVIWRWCGGKWIVDKSSIPPGVDMGPPPNFGGEFEGQYVKTQIVPRSR